MPLGHDRGGADDFTSRTDNDYFRRLVELSRIAKRRRHTERPDVGHGQFNLSVRAKRPDHGHPLDLPLRPAKRHALLGDELLWL